MKAAKNLAKHGVSFLDAVEVLSGWTYDLPAKTVEGELREMSIGELEGVVILAVVWTARGRRDRIISARLASTSEKNAYHASKKTRP